MPLSSSSPFAISYRLAIWGGLLFGLLVSLWGYYSFDRIARTQLADSIGRLAQVSRSQFQGRIDSNLEVLDVVSGALENMPTLSRESFAHLVNPALARHPEIWAIHWVPRVAHQDRARYEQALSALNFGIQGLSELKLPENRTVPAQPRSVYFPIIFSEPILKNRTVLGFDARSRVSNAAAMDAAVQNNSLFWASSAFKIIQDASGPPAVLIYRPVYQKDRRLTSVSDREAALLGFVAIVLRPSVLIEKILGSLPDVGVDYYLYQGQDGADRTLLYHHVSRLDTSLVQERGIATEQASLVLPGQQWALQISVSDIFLKTNGINITRKWWVLWGGVAFSFLVSGFLWLNLRAHRATHRERDRAQLYLDTVEAIILVLDQQGCITRINRKGCQLLGQTEAALLGQRWRDFLSDGDTSWPDMAAQNVMSTRFYHESALALPNQETRYIAWHSVLMTEGDSATVGLLCAGEDVTERRRAMIRERARNAALQLAAAAAPLSAVFEAIIAGVEQEDPSMLCSILLLDREGRHLLYGAAPSLPEAYSRAIHGVEIGDGVGSCGTAAYRGARVIVENIQTHPYWRDFKGIAAQHHLGSCWSTPIKNGAGKVLGTFAIYHHQACAPNDVALEMIESTADIVSLVIEHHHAQMTLLSEKQKFETLLHTAGDGIVVLDLEGRVRVVNDAFCKTLGYPKEKLMTMRPWDWDADLGETSIRLMMQDILHKPTCFDSRHRDVHGNIRHVEISVAAITLEDETLIWTSSRDISERKALEAELRKQSTTDPLTGAPNRRYFMDRMESECVRARRHRRPLAVLMLDLDFFKIINDSFGHAYGDKVLRHTVETCLSLLRQNDVVGRIGGEEFALLLPETGEEGALEVAERLRARISEIRIPIHEQDQLSAAPAFSCSIGVALYSHNDSSHEAFLSRADAALYQAKARGRNRVVLASTQVSADFLAQ